MVTFNLTEIRIKVARLMDLHGPVSSAGIRVHLPEISASSASNVLRRGVEVGAFKPLPAAPKTYILTSKGRKILEQETIY